jgi:hypothetical protein
MATDNQTQAAAIIEIELTSKNVSQINMLENIIDRCLKDMRLFVFGEILDLPNIKSVSIFEAYLWSDFS